MCLLTKTQIGINVGQKNALKGCRNDALNMWDFIISASTWTQTFVSQTYHPLISSTEYYGFNFHDILVLIDDGCSNGLQRRRCSTRWNGSSRMHAPMTRSSFIVSPIGIYNGQRGMILILQILGMVDRPRMIR